MKAENNMWTCKFDIEKIKIGFKCNNYWRKYIQWKKEKITTKRLVTEKVEAGAEDFQKRRWLPSHRAEATKSSAKIYLYIIYFSFLFYFNIIKIRLV